MDGSLKMSSIIILLCDSRVCYRNFTETEQSDHASRTSETKNGSGVKNGTPRRLQYRIVR